MGEGNLIICLTCLIDCMIEDKCMHFKIMIFCYVNFNIKL